MKRFVINFAIFSMLPACLIAVSFLLADGTVDPFYLRFTTPKQSNLILGTSRAAQALQPEIIDGVFNENGITSQMFNFSFTLAHSPYGPVYFEAIKKKLQETANNGIYIVAVDPWSISSNAKDANDINGFEEIALCLGKTKNVNSNGLPNGDYLINSFSKPLFSIYVDRLKNVVRQPTTILHKNGWLEVEVNMDSAAAKERLLSRLEEYRTHFVPYYHFSSVRFLYLQKIIDFLSEHGNVYLVRLPVDENMKKLDDKLVPNFDKLITNLAQQKGATYINYTQDYKRYSYTDGNHLYKSSGRELSRKLGRTIAELQKQSDKQKRIDFLTRK